MAEISKFGLQSTAIEEWIPWGGIVEPWVMKQKDRSLFCVIAYDRYTTDLEQQMEVWNFRRGWTLWSEHQSGSGKEHLVVCWNPFVTRGRTYVSNAIHGKVKMLDTVEGFQKEMELFLAEMQKFTRARFLEYQELMDFLSYTISFGENRQEMPDIPLYMDVLLTQDVQFDFGANDIWINQKRLVVASLLSPVDFEAVYEAFEGVPFRHVRRLLCLSQKQAETDLKRYTSRWYPSRKILRSLGNQGIVAKYNGYYSEAFLFLAEEDAYRACREKLQYLLDGQHVPYIFESFNLKEVFWGSIPGLYLANARPPVVGFRSFSELLRANIRIVKKEQIEIRKRVLTDTEQRLKATLEEGGEAVVSS